MHIGFTGTRLGLSPKQRHSLRTVLAELSQGDLKWFHHGDCVGADEEAHDVANALGYFIHVHPPSDDKYRAHRSGAQMSEPAPYMVRNQAIVDTCAILVVCARTYHGDAMTTRSGTWATYRMARKKGIPRVIVYADGTVVHESSA